MNEKCIIDDEKEIIANEKKIFDKDVKNCKLERDHLLDDITDSRLKRIDELFGDADAVSRENDVKTNKQRLLIAVCGIVVTILFMFYGEGENNFLISLISFLLIGVICMIIIINNNKKRHMKHIKYRVIAESLRAQFFVSYAGIDKNVFDMMPWVIKCDIPLIKLLLCDLPKLNSADRNAYFLFCQGEEDYHLKSIEDYDGNFYKKYKFVLNLAKIITIFSFALALAFETYLYFISPAGLDLNLIHFIIKLIMGLATIITLLINGLFGKMSLGTKVDDHERMEKLYKEKYMEIFLNYENKTKSEEIFLSLIGEFLIQASTKYVYQSKNNLEFIL